MRNKWNEIIIYFNNLFTYKTKRKIADAAIVIGFIFFGVTFVLFYGHVYHLNQVACDNGSNSACIWLLNQGRR